MCFYAGSVGYKTLCVRWDATTGTCYQRRLFVGTGKDRKNGGGRERVAVSRNRADTFLVYSSTLRFCRAIVVSRTAGLEIAILKNGEVGHAAKDWDSFHVAAPRLVAERNP